MYTITINKQLKSAINLDFPNINNNSSKSQTLHSHSEKFFLFPYSQAFNF